MDEILRLQKLAGILTEIKVNNPILQKVKNLFLEKYKAPKDAYDGNLSEEVEEKFITPNNIEWGDDEFLIDLFDRLPNNELNRLYDFLLKYVGPKEDDEDWMYDLDEIKVNKPDGYKEKILKIYYEKNTTKIPSELIQKYYDKYIGDTDGRGIFLKKLEEMLEKMSQLELIHLHNIMEKY